MAAAGRVGLVHRRQQPNSGAERLARELERPDRLNDRPRIDEIVGNVERLAPFQEERPLLGE